MARPDNTQSAVLSNRIAAWALFLLTLLLYWQTAGYQFVNLDDPSFVTDNPHIRTGLTASSIWWALTTNFVNWQPLVFLSHMAVVTIFGMDPAAHHLVNALLHAGNAALVFLVLRRLRLPSAPAILAAALFAFHPLRVESVAWVSERKDVLGALFWLLTVWAYVSYTEARQDRRRYALLLLCFSLGLMSKPVLVTLPVCLLILDYWPLARWQREPIRQLVLEKVPLVALAVIVAVATILGQESFGAMSTLNDLPLSQRLCNVVRSYALYLWKTLWPTDLAVLYPFPDSYPVAEVAVAAILLAGISYWTWQRRKSEPMWLAAWLWYLVAAAPTIGFIQVGPQPYADRYTYLPSILPMAALALAVSRLWTPAVFRMVGVAAAAVLFVASWLQIGTWRDNETLYRHAIAVAPGASLVYFNLGVALEQKGKFNEAIANYEVARQLNESDPGPSLSIGLAYLLSGRPAQAVDPLTKAVSLSPSSPAVRYQYARALLETGRLDEAVAEANKALALSPPNALAATLHMQIGLAAYMRKDDTAALAEFREALRLDPQYGPARKNAGIALGNLGRNQEAIAELQQYLRANPADQDVAAAIAALQGGK